MPELYDEYTCCVNLDEDWWIKIKNNYGIHDFISIKNNLRNKDSIKTVNDIFDHLILPQPKLDQFGNLIEWEIDDRENLYMLNQLPENYMDKFDNPKCCFDPESEDLVNLKNDTIKNYFDNTIIDF